MDLTLSYETWEKAEKPVFSIDNETKGAFNVLSWAMEHYGDDIVYACSFGAESMPLIDLMMRVRSNVRLVFLDTGLHFKETHEVIQKVKDRYPGLEIQLMQPELTVEEQAEQYGENLWDRKPDQCCHLRKIVPLERALAGATAWISGLRRSQSPTRQFTQFINRDERFHSIKICPLIHWSWKDVWSYIKEHDLPYNILHDRGYPSIGCAPCTRPVAKGEDIRAGRWFGLQKTECGLHGGSPQKE